MNKKFIIIILVLGAAVFGVQQLQILNAMYERGEKIEFSIPKRSQDPIVPRMANGIYTKTPQGTLVYTENPNGLFKEEKITGQKIEAGGSYYDPVTQTYRAEDGKLEQTPSLK